ncbi:hypothetical protein SALBM311S_00258 [Streptomyces alboniger]
MHQRQALDRQLQVAEHELDRFVSAGSVSSRAPRKRSWNRTTLESSGRSLLQLRVEQPGVAEHGAVRLLG